MDMCRSCINTCRNCVKLCVLNKRVSDYSAKILYVEIDHFSDLFHIKLIQSFIKKLFFCNKIAVISCSLFDLSVIVEIFENYQRRVDVFSLSLDIDQNE